MRNLFIGLILMTSAATAQETTIAALGDSLTAGYGLAASDGFVPVMQGWLDGQGVEVTVLNAGVSGDTTAGGAARVDWTLTDDVDGMIVALGGNDLLRGLDPAESEQNLREILQVAVERDVEVLLIGLSAGNNYGSEYADAFNGMYVSLSKEFDVPLVETWFQGVLDAAGSQERVRDYMQRDGIHPNPQGVEVIVEALGPDVMTLVGRSQE